MATAARIKQAAAALSVAAPALSRNARQIVLGQAMVESQFGDVHKTPTGASSHNWGNIYAPGDLGTIPVGDTQDGVPFTANAAWNSSDVVGAKQLVTLLQKSYSPALDKAARGDLFGYAQALWRGGPGSSRPPYYGGFPPGHPYSIAPKGTVLHSELDHYYRILAYKRYVQSGAKAVASVLGEPFAMNTSEPSPPSTSSGFWAWVGMTAFASSMLYAWQAGWMKKLQEKWR